MSQLAENASYLGSHSNEDNDLCEEIIVPVSPSDLPFFSSQRDEEASSDKFQVKEQSTVNSLIKKELVDEKEDSSKDNCITKNSKNLSKVPDSLQNIIKNKQSNNTYEFCTEPTFKNEVLDDIVEEEEGIDSKTFKNTLARNIKSCKTVQKKVLPKGFNTDESKTEEESERKRKLWDPERMAKAIKAVREKKMGFLKAAKAFGVPRTSLYRLSNCEGEAIKAASKALGRKPILSEELELALVKHLYSMDCTYLKCTREEICTLAYELAVCNNIAHPFGKNNKAGKYWFHAFMKRYQDKLLFKPCATTRRSTVKKGSKIQKSYSDLYCDDNEVEIIIP